MTRKFTGLLTLVLVVPLSLAALAVTSVQPNVSLKLPVPEAARTSGCSLASLKGPYALDRQGTLVASILGLPAPAAWGEMAREDFDGAGGFSGKATINIGGAVGSATVTGTYTLNHDCTGTKTVNTNGGVTVHEAIIVIGGGQRMIGTQTDPWAVVQTRAEKIGD
jgi:hypothetical protein